MISPATNFTRKSKSFTLGPHNFGGSADILVQSMWDKPLSAQLKEEEKALQSMFQMGCDLMRFAVPDIEAAESLGKLAEKNIMPLVADIHFDYRLAMRVMDFPIVKIRINPGNIGAPWKVEEVIRKAQDRGIALRVGANEGSLPKSLKNHKNKVEAMILSVLEQLELLEKIKFQRVVVSLKSHSVDRTIEANRLFAKDYDYPLHLGVTEAGPLIPSLIKSSLALGTLLKENIGDTLRISISDSPFKEIQAARELLSQLHLNRRKHVEIISCPKCGRTSFDTHKFTEEIEAKLLRLNKDISLAIMGCEVNGPGEAKQADLGITGSGERIIIFKKGKIIRKEPMDKALEAFWEELEKL
ncbi:MAG: flavodoxin-dependent (E)-4-hydroxy-3-methylbut-2-enyl-diphosphate synthase [Spirochaetaceae bacterium]|jgi:(E)-4-hydroxy-3-methylbut-2-enyl-diphosphate synthase|nr:flavodoxin-dependent (E)-4-hydroxy-3-methylbut-2-enyl-diphosphate synthase [Spirochaetaceae bacterium]